MTYSSEPPTFSPSAVLLPLAQQLREQASRVLIGQEAAIELLLVSLFTRGHVLLEGVPGTAKTLMAKTLASLVQAEYRRIQFTPDLMPSDVVGTVVYDMQASNFNLKRGPIFSQIILADEINRAPAKTQAALLEAMEERQVTIEGSTMPLPEPFMVIATQNPVEMDGTYPLPEAQLDRFLFKIKIDYLAQPQETEVLRRYHQGFDAHNLAAVQLHPVLNPNQLAQIRQIIQSVTVEDGILNYIAAITDATRRSNDLALGASTRAGVAMLLAAKTFAALRGRDYTSPDDVKSLAPPILRHRIMLRPEAEVEGLDSDSVIRRILAKVEVPR
ncbi:MAG: AAA domain-containing protein [Anaerolineaceae bacterium]|nr:AAA domain-containing protein [Anaerolineaceae bacterium]